jgi:hypothetical protein
MIRLVASLALLLSMLMLPLGMGGVTAKPMTPHHAGMAMPMEHCADQSPERSSDHRLKAGFAECTMACSAALPVIDDRSCMPERAARSTHVVAIMAPLGSQVPEIATPPPKNA